jgi:hypothetical protein
MIECLKIHSVFGNPVDYTSNERISESHSGSDEIVRHLQVVSIGHDHQRLCIKELANVSGCQVDDPSFTDIAKERLPSIHETGCY